MEMGRPKTLVCAAIHKCRFALYRRVLTMASGLDSASVVLMTRPNVLLVTSPCDRQMPMGGHGDERLGGTVRIAIGTHTSVSLSVAAARTVCVATRANLDLGN